MYVQYTYTRAHASSVSTDWKDISWAGFGELEEKKLSFIDKWQMLEGTGFLCLVDYAVLSCLNLSHIRKAGTGLQKTPLNYRRDTAFNEPCRLLLKINGKKNCSCLLIEFGKLSLLSACKERSTGKVTSMGPGSFVVLSGKSCLFSKAWNFVWQHFRVLGGMGLVFCFLFLFGLFHSCCLWNYFILP